MKEIMMNKKFILIHVSQIGQKNKSFWIKKKTCVNMNELDTLTIVGIEL